MAEQQVPRAAAEYVASNTAEIGAATSAVQRLWSRMDPSDLDGSYAAIEPTLLAVWDTAQDRMQAAGTAYVPAVMRETGQRLPLPDYALAPGSLVGTAGDGRPTEGLAYRALIHTKSEIASGASTESALLRASRFLTRATGTLMSDTHRTAERVSGASRGVTLWVRVLVPPSCGRCVILAGRVTGNGMPFLRHPRCDCTNVPATPENQDSLLADPHAYLDDLSDDDLARALGSRANARAFRDGADQNQLVNAYRHKGDVRSAQVYGRNVKYTTEGTTRRGLAGQRMRAAGLAREGEAKRGRYMALKSPRLMPESIYQIATSPEDAQRLLRLYGWIL